MSDGAEDAVEAVADDILALRTRNAELEHRIGEMQAASNERLLRAELKAEAVRAGMIDLDGLKLVDAGAVGLDEHGEVHGARAAISQLRRNKPWLFGQASSSSTATPPPSGMASGKLATDMTLEEWRAARAELVRRR